LAFSWIAVPAIVTAGEFSNLSVMPAPVAGIHVFLWCYDEGVDGRDEPGHDESDSP
jgi:hypothetical protein